MRQRLAETIGALFEAAAVYLFYFAAKVYHHGGYHYEEDRVRSMLQIGHIIHRENQKLYQQQLRAEKAPLN